MLRLKFFPVILFSILVSTSSVAQNISWLEGRWMGKAYLPGSDVSQDYLLMLRIFSIKGNRFEGIISALQSSDTSIRFDSRISGIVYENFLIIHRDKILYIRDGKNVRWKISCNNCKPPPMYFSIENRKFYFRGEMKDCFKECNGISEFSREVAEFDSSAKEEVYALAKTKMDTIEVAQNNAPPIDTPKIIPEANERIPVLAAGDVALITSNSAFHSTYVHSIQKNASIIVRQNAIRVPLLAAGDIVSTKATTTFNSSPVHTILKNESLIVQQNVLLRIPLVVGGNIELIKHNTVTNFASVHSVKRNPSLVLQQYVPTENIAQRIPFPDAGTIVMSVKKNAMLPHKRYLVRSPGYNVQQNIVNVAQKKLPSSVDTLASIARNNNQPTTDKIASAPVKSTAVALPTDYTERKKNVIRTIMVNTDSITLRVYDNGVVDGDVVSVILNDKVVIDKLSLTSHAFEVKVPVNLTGINNLVFHAHNLGEYPPNTAQLEILYGNKKEELTVSSDLTVSSMIDIIHQQ